MFLVRIKAAAVVAYTAVIMFITGVEYQLVDNAGNEIVI